jgi:hypothetical protein
MITAPGRARVLAGRIATPIDEALIPPGMVGPARSRALPGGHSIYFVDMNNHSHNLAVSHTRQELAKVYMKVQKKTTDAIKWLVSLSCLSLWEDRPYVTRAVALEAVIDRIVYIYCNLSNAALYETIEECPGINSWSTFLTCEPSVDAEVAINAPWYTGSEIPRLPARSLSPSQDAALLRGLLESEGAHSHPIVLKPFK